jgi:hypothetical protein
MNAQKFVSYLTDDAQFKFGNNPASVGKASVREAVDGFFTTIKGLSHNIAGVWVHPDAVICQGEVTYTRTDDGKVTVPFADILGMEGDKVKDYLIYIDVAPLYAPAA